VLDKMRLLPKLSERGSFFPRRVNSWVGQGTAEMDNMSLLALPLMKCLS